MPVDGDLFWYVAFLVEDDDIIPAFARRRAENSEHAVRAAKALSKTYAGAMAWCITGADGPDREMEILFSQGAVGDID